MTPEEKSLLERTYKLAEDNNSLLCGIRRSGRIRTALHALYWVIIVILSFGAYYFIQPYVTTMLDVFDQVGGLSGFQNSMNQAQNAANSFREFMK